ncbi:MAG TPA: M55 family metallopeptidase [Vicinamibacteria bacterium]|nr:M55 family metallopeptidase [Vicinamibacteria bacterium]
MRLGALAGVLWMGGASISAGAEPPRKLKVHVSVDMEGVAGVVSGDQLGPTEFEYQRFREFMTKEAIAAVQAAREAGATEIVVADSHGNGQNLLIEQFPSDVRVVRSWPRPLGMMGGIDASFDAAIFIGYHASTDNPRGVRAHTFRSALFTHVGLSGHAISEGWMNAALAGHFGVPVVMASGDDVAMAELRQQLGAIETAEVKRSLGFHSAETLTPAASVELIARKVKAALARRWEFKAVKVEGAPTLEIGFKHYLAAEVASYLPAAERTDAHSVRFRVRDIVEASNLLTFLDNWDQDLKP